jgi:hypothetical protein
MHARVIVKVGRKISDFQLPMRRALPDIAEFMVWGALGTHAYLRGFTLQLCRIGQSENVEGTRNRLIAGDAQA